MGVLNITPDSFSDGGQFLDRDNALYRAEQIVAEGAAVLDIGGESTRPGAMPVSLQEELDRVIPIIEALTAEFPIPLSIDTQKPVVMQAAIAAGANIVNDIRALQEEGALAIVANSRAAVCLMHMQGLPQTMQVAPHYEDIIAEIKQFFSARIAACVAAGIAPERIILDPGFGFGKTMQHNMTLISQLTAFAEFTQPLLIGVSRKATVGKILNAPVDGRLFGSIALAVLAVNNGARLVRAHDVKATVEALQVVQAVKRNN